MKLGIFTDPHYSSAELTCGRRYNSRSLAKIEAALARFAAEKCDLVVCLGDLIDREPTHEAEAANLAALARVFDTAGLPAAVVRGNHDAFSLSKEDFYRILGSSRYPADRVFEDKTLIFLDACHFASGRSYAPGDTDWTDTFLPDTDGLRARLSAVPGEAIVLMHQNIDPNIRADHSLKNAAEVREILEQSGKVRLVLQGHYHPGTENTHNGILYRAFPAMCERDDAVFILEV